MIVNFNGLEQHFFDVKFQQRPNDLISSVRIPQPQHISHLKGHPAL